MADWYGKKMRTTKVEKTKILPLRWIGNWCGAIATKNLIMAVDLDEDANWGFKYKYRAKVWKVLNKPYRWWGTYYEYNFSEFTDVLNRIGSDYDEDGIPYWEKDKGNQD